MSRSDQVPPTTDVILYLNVPCAGPSPARLEKSTSGLTGVTGRPSGRCSSIRKSAVPGTWRPWCGTRTWWLRAGRSITLSAPFRRCKRSVEIDRRRGQPQITRASPTAMARISTSDGSQSGRSACSTASKSSMPARVPPGGKREVYPPTSTAAAHEQGRDSILTGVVE
jgi:hypothetical protein